MVSELSHALLELSLALQKQTVAGISPESVGKLPACSHIKLCTRAILCRRTWLSFCSHVRFSFHTSSKYLCVSNFNLRSKVLEHDTKAHTGGAGMMIACACQL